MSKLSPAASITCKIRFCDPAAIAAAVTRDVGGVPVPLCAIKDMIALKQNTGRKQDESDIEHLRRIQKGHRA